MFMLNFGLYGITEENVVLTKAGRSQGVVTNQMPSQGYGNFTSFGSKWGIFFTVMKFSLNP